MGSPHDDSLWYEQEQRRREGSRVDMRAKIARLTRERDEAQAAIKNAVALLVRMAADTEATRNAFREGVDEIAAELRKRIDEQSAQETKP